MRPIKTQQGIALVYVVLLIGGLSTVFVHHSYISNIRAERTAFAFTIAQIHHVLNLAYAHRLATGRWPRTNDGVCETPEQYIDDFDTRSDGPRRHETLNNGWGYPLEGLDECGGASESYVIQQIIPEKYFQRFEDSLEEELARDYTDVAEGMVRMRLELPLSLVERQRISVGKLTDRFNSPLAFQYINCPASETPRYIGGLDGWCGVAPADPLEAIIHYIPPAVFSGFEVDLRPSFSGMEIRYEMVVNDSSEYDRNDEGAVIAFVLIGNDDGHAFADEQCPRNRNQQRYTIDAVLLSWCEKQE